jgi:hypothetical protein
MIPIKILLPAVRLGLLVLGPVLVPHAQATDYYMNSAGADTQVGTAPERAWRTIARANQQVLAPGDRLLLHGGETFAGNLVIKTGGTSSAQSPITIGSYGPGKAVLSAGQGTGLASTNTGGLVLRELIIQSSGRRTNQGSGILVLNRLPGGKQLAFIRIENIEARGFGKDGIAVAGDPPDSSRSGFRDVRITGCRASDNAETGIHVFGKHDYYARTYSNRDVAILDCVANDNPGNPNDLAQHTGDGILLHDVDGGLIDACTASGNGGLCRAKGGGPVGIWAWSSRKLVIQNCVSVRNRTGGKYDGGGFDLDGGVSESVLQYNYSAENDGAGFLVYDFGAAPFRMTNNVVRFNVSERDGRKNGFAGIHVDSLGAPIERLLVYHNTVFVGPSQIQEQPVALFVRQSKDSRIHNNLLITAGGCALVDFGEGPGGLKVQGNHYWAADGPFVIRQASKVFGSLTEWRRQTGMERLDRNVGSTGDPRLNAVRGAVVTDAGRRTTLDHYLLQDQSPLLHAGLDLRLLVHVDPGERDFWGNRLSRDMPPAVGAHAGGRPHP